MTDTNIRKAGSSAAEHVSERPAVAAQVDVYENAKELLLVADLPGVNKDNLNVHVDAETLTVEGHRAQPPAGSLISAEYRPFDFRRTFTVPAGIDRNRIEAELSAGVLRLHLPKEEKPEPRKIPIRLG